MKLSVASTLVAAMTVLVNGEAVQCKSVELSDLSTGDLFEARAKANEGEYWALHELAAKCVLIDKDDGRHPMSYEALRDTSSANFKLLEELDQKLQVKLKAESLESQSS